MKPNPYAGKFIAFDGLDGSGQSTQAELLGRFLSSKGIGVVLTKEPTTESSVSGRIRNVLDKKESLGFLELQKLFVKDREEHLSSVILPALEKGSWVITDRYVLTAFAYSLAAGLDIQEVMSWHESVLEPDLSLFLKVSPETAAHRLAERAKNLTLFEDMEGLSKNVHGFESAAKEFPNVVVINAEASIEETAEAVRSAVVTRFHI